MGERALRPAEQAALEARLRSAAAALPMPVDPAELGRRLQQRIFEESSLRSGAPDGAGGTGAGRRRHRFGTDSVGEVSDHRIGRRLSLAAAVVALLAAATVAVPSGRRAVAGWLGLRGARIARVPVDAPAPTTLGPTATNPTAAAPFADLDLGQPTTLADAAAAGDATVVRLTDPELGTPVALFRRVPPAGGMVTLVYRVGDRTVLFSQFTATTSPFIGKTARDDTTVTPVTVAGAPGYWLDGAPHELFYDVGADTIVEPTRLASDTLLWDVGGRTYRLEGAPDLTTALRWAASAAPAR